MAVMAVNVASACETFNATVSLRSAAEAATAVAAIATTNPILHIVFFMGLPPGSTWPVAELPGCDVPKDAGLNW
jgi:hypothetical protein